MPLLLQLVDSADRRQAVGSAAAAEFVPAGRFSVDRRNHKIATFVADRLAMSPGGA